MLGKSPASPVRSDPGTAVPGEISMKIRWMIAVVTLASAGSPAFATDVYHPARSAEEGVVLRTDHMKGLNRVQVEDDVLAARREGTLTNISRGYPPRFPLMSAPVSNRTRDQVQQEFQSWKMQPLTPDGRRMLPGVGLLDREAP
jgi:hypothetical protein